MQILRRDWTWVYKVIQKKACARQSLWHSEIRAVSVTALRFEKHMQTSKHTTKKVSGKYVLMVNELYMVKYQLWLAN